MLTEIGMPMKPEQFRQLASFDNMFHRVNLALGVRMWLRTNALAFLIVFVAALVGILQALPPSLAMGLVFALNIALFQWSAALEGARLLRIPVSPFCWLSINWRLLLYMLPLIFVFAMLLPPEILQSWVEADPAGQLDEPALEAMSDNLALAQAILAIVSIIPMGLATAQALVVSLDKYAAMAGSGRGKEGDDEDRPSG